MQGGPKTIIITAFPRKTFAAGNIANRSVSTCVPSLSSFLPLKRPLSSATISSSGVSQRSMSVVSPCPSSYYEDDDSDSEFQPTRKRERLNHLSPEEKTFRRKMKNRIAAQTARDRKKVQMVDLEERVRRLESENESLKQQNNKLAAFSTDLSDENSRLKSEISFKSAKTSVFTLENVKLENCADSTTVNDEDGVATIALESAEFISGLQQQGQAIGADQSTPVTRALKLFLAVVTAMSSFSTGCTISSSESCKTGQIQDPKMDVKEIAENIRQKINLLSITSNGKRLLTEKLEDLLRFRKTTRLKMG